MLTYVPSAYLVVAAVDDKSSFDQADRILAYLRSNTVLIKLNHFAFFIEWNAAYVPIISKKEYTEPTRGNTLYLFLRIGNIFRRGRFMRIPDLNFRRIWE